MTKKYRISGKIWTIIAFSILLIIPQSCQKDNEPGIVTPEAGDLIQASSKTTYSASNIAAILNAFDADFPLDVKHSVDFVKITYYTSDPSGELVMASGALMIPKDVSDLPSVCYHHGTESKRSLVASVNPLGTAEGFAGLIMASVGFLTFEPDYLGLGDSDIMHPYLFAKSYGDASIDMLKAGVEYCSQEGITLNWDLYLGGYSEGGYATLAVQKEIEKQFSFDFELVANAPQAGPYDLYETTRYFLEIEEYPEPTFLAYMVTAYDDAYNWNRLDDFFVAPYAGMMDQLFDGTNTVGEISGNLPDKISLLLKESFMTGFLNGSETSFINAVKENTLLDWTPSAPIRFFHSNADEIVPYQNSLTAVENFEMKGGSEVSFVTIEGLKHGEAALTSISQMTVWFDSLRTTR